MSKKKDPKHRLWRSTSLSLSARPTGPVIVDIIERTLDEEAGRAGRVDASLSAMPDIKFELDKDDEDEDDYGMPVFKAEFEPQKVKGEEEGGTASLRAVLLRHLRTRDGSSPLFAEVHQKQSGGIVEAVVPNTAEADSMVGSLNRQMPAFLKHYLLYRGFPGDFVTRLISASCCPTLVGDINTVRWDEKNLDLIMIEDAEEEARLSAFEKSDWFMDLEQLQVSAKKKKHFTAPEALFNLDEVQSVKTLHAKNDEKRAAARAEAEDYTSEEESESVYTPEEGNNDKSPQDLVEDTAAGTVDKSITWSPSSPSVGRPATRGAAGSG